MDYLLSIFAGMVQGLTEFLPISSSGHLVIFHEVFNFELPDNVLFDVVVHLAGFFALLIFFYKEILRLVAGFFSSLSHWDVAGDINQRLAWAIIVGTVPAVMAGFFLEDIIVYSLRHSVVVAIALIVGAGLLWWFERVSLKNKVIGDMSVSKGLIVGLAQAMALIPGLSRSGMTIVAGLGLGLNRADAAKFSFLLGMPILLGAGVKKILSVDSTADINFLILSLGFLASFVTSYVVIKYFLKFLVSHSLNVFVVYRLVIGCLILIWSVLI